MAHKATRGERRVACSNEKSGMSGSALTARCGDGIVFVVTVVTIGKITIPSGGRGGGLVDCGEL